MIIGIGVDMCRVSRMERAIRSDRFVQRVFSPGEIDYALEKAVPARHFAACFAAREAFSKASGIPMYSLVFGPGLWVERTQAAPQVRMAPAIMELLPFRGEELIHLSLTHDGDYAVAVVVVEAPA